MSEQFFKHIKKAGEEISLSHEERERMRRVVRQYMEMKPIRRPVPAATTAGFKWLFTLRPLAGALMLIFLVSSAGISSSAEHALPGDFLYPIKTQFDEPIQGTFAFSSSEKTLWASNVAQERVKEAAMLDTEGRLSTTTQQELQLNFEEHTQTADRTDHTARPVVASSLTVHATTTAAVGNSFQVRVKEYENILSRIAGSREGLFASSTWNGDVDSGMSSTSASERGGIFPEESSSTQSSNSSKKTDSPNEHHRHPDSSTTARATGLNVIISTAYGSATTSSTRSSSSNLLEGNESNSTATTTITTQSSEAQHTQTPIAPVATFPIHFPF